MKDNVELLEIPGKWEINYLYSAGMTASLFFSALKEGNKFLATKCPKCHLVYLPPRSFCEKCFVKIDEWLPLPLQGTVETFTIVLEKFEGFPSPPYIVAYVKIDGADTAMANFIEGVDLSEPRQALKKLKIGTKVRAKFKDKREGKMTDFVFEPL